MRHYELLFILRPTLTEEEAKAKVDFIKEVLEKNGANIAAIQNIGTRKLAYKVKRFERGLYTSIYFVSPANTIAELERIVRITEEIIKFLTVKFENKKEIAHWEQSVSKVNLGSKKTKEAVAETAENKEEA